MQQGEKVNVGKQKEFSGDAKPAVRDFYIMNVCFI